MMLSPEQVAGVMCVSLVVLGIGTLVGAIILRLAVSLYNLLAGGVTSPGGVPIPTFVKAIGICFLTMLANTLTGLAVGFVIRGAPVAAGARQPLFNLTAELIKFPISVLVMAGLLAALLPTKFGRAILVALCEYLIAAVIVGIVILLAVVLPLGLMR